MCGGTSAEPRPPVRDRRYSNRGWPGDLCSSVFICVLFKWVSGRQRSSADYPSAEQVLPPFAFRLSPFAKGYNPTTMNLILIIVFSVLFPLTHMLMSHGSIRSGLIKTLHGEWPFRGFYSLVSFLTLGPSAAIWWGHRHLGPELWDLPFWLERAVALPLMLLAMVLLVLMLAAPSPAGLIPGALRARGVLRITRHPMNIAFACFGLAHLVSNGFLGDVFFFGQFAVLGILGSYHQDARKLREKGEPYREFMRTTSVLPFVAILRGRNRLDGGELAFPLFLIAVAVFVALVVFHGRLFGAAVF